MELFLRPLADVNDVTWSIVISLLILLAGVSYYIYTIMSMAFKSWTMSDLTNKDAEQDTKIAVMDSTLENSIRRIEMVHKRVDDTNEEIEKLRERVRKLERWVWSAGAVITALITIVGIADALNAKEIDYGRYGSTQQEVVLQLPRS